MKGMFTAGNGPVQISAEAIQKRVAQLGEAIAQDYQGKTPHLICVLNGAFIFMADLVRAIPLPLTMDFIAISSYGNALKSSGRWSSSRTSGFPSTVGT